MNISPEQLEKFKQIYKEKLGKEISALEARLKAGKLIRLLKVIDKPMTEQDYKDAKLIIEFLNSNEG